MTEAHGRFLHELPGHLAERLVHMEERGFLGRSHALHPFRVALILNGIVSVTQRHAEGRDVLMSFRGPGGLVGENRGLTDQDDQEGTPEFPDAFAVTRAQVIYLNPGMFRRFMQDHPPAWQALAKELADRLEEAEHRLCAAACENADQRLARLLLTVPTARQENDGTVTVCDLSKEDMAAWVGVRRETIERRFKAWRESGTIRTGYREVTLIDLPRLARIAKLLPGTGRSTAA